MDNPLWRPSEARIAAANLTAFAKKAEAKYGVALPDYPAIHKWSVTEVEAFWQEVWDFCGVLGERGATVLADGDKMPGARFFPEARLNFAENLLRRRGPETAIAFWGEDKVKRRMSFDELHALVSRLQQVLRDLGVAEGDRVAGFMPNMPETVAAMLATASLGAVWSSCSPDFGVQGVLDRFGQIEPKVLFCPDGYYYNSKAIDSLSRVAEFSAQLPSLQRIIVCPYLSDAPDVSGLANGVRLADAIAGKTTREIEFSRVPFNSPLYIMYSSGTTGKPKCIVHGAGGTLLKHLSEHVLLCDVKPGDKVFYFTTCGWMMWNWLVSAQAAEATMLLYDGSPFAPDGNILFDYADS
jgi:acetoacetyl-CoA synthetase